MSTHARKQVIAVGYAAQILSSPGLESDPLSKLQPLMSYKMLSGIKHIFTGPGDWVPPPASPDNPAFRPETKVDGACSAGFSFVNDVAVWHPEN